MEKITTKINLFSVLSEHEKLKLHPLTSFSRVAVSVSLLSGEKKTSKIFKQPLCSAFNLILSSNSMWTIKWEIEIVAKVKLNLELLFDFVELIDAFEGENKSGLQKTKLSCEIFRKQHLYWNMVWDLLKTVKFS